MNFHQRVQKNYSQLSESDKYLISFLEKNFKGISQISILKLSENANVSTSTIVRCMKKLGYKGFTDFKFNVASETLHHTDEELINFKNMDKQIQTAILKNREEVVNTISYLSSTIIEDALEAIKYSKKITIFSRGFSEFIASEMNTKLQLLDKHCESHGDPNIIRLKSEHLTRDDLVIFISLNGETEELVQAAQICNNHSVKTILLTTSKGSSLYNLTDINLLGYKSSKNFYPEYEVRSRLPLQVLGRILLDAYVIRYYE
ncbi:MurR/RpiR family transcriptional regulator [Salinicoccus sesuvii]|uniref:MurR/RpiR family transcriptional regulator n=1 Tax=Salinicoccus sesuvii TaxID=868281 RepID=A0ABV7N5S5_9STAP